MVGKSYTDAERLEAVALGRVIGATAAGKQLGIDDRTLRGWMAELGDRPEDGPDPGTWRALMDLTLARVTAQVASGKLPATVVATIAGIAARNAHRDAAPGPTGLTALAARQVFDDWCFDEYLGDEHVAHLEGRQPTEAQWEAALDALERDLVRVHRELLRRANRERGQPHRLALLLWFHGAEPDPRQPVPAGDVVTWCQAHVTRLVERYGSLPAALDHAEDVRQRWDARTLRRAERLAEQARVRFNVPAPTPPPSADELTRLLAEADRILEEFTRA